MSALIPAVLGLIQDLSGIVVRAVTASKEDHEEILKYLDESLQAFDRARIKLVADLKTHDEAIDAALTEKEKTNGDA